MKRKSCKGCKRENTTDLMVVRAMCKNCWRNHGSKSETDYYERKVKID